MVQQNIKNIISKVYPTIAKDYSCNAKVEVYDNIYSRLSGISEMSGEDNACAEYDWNENKIYIYTTNMNNEEDIIKALIHECVHSTQNKELFEALYECGLDYTNHPYEIEAEYEEGNWKKYKLNTISIG
tara:strand:- start:128 stop:514 length:387 start_codon:yes stop_codon:yes gene_type:complete